MSGRTFLRFLQSFLHTGTPSSSTFLRGDGAWASAFSGGGPYGEFITPTSVTAITSDGITGDVTDMQTLLDGNIYQIEEAVGAPGYNIEFSFTNVGSIAGFVTMIRYDGSTTHDVGFGFHNYTNASDADRTSPYSFDDIFLQINHSDTLYSYRTVLIPQDTDYIKSGVVTAFLDHTSSGNASHVAYIDYIALIGTSA